jgi:hypothetical protein
MKVVKSEQPQSVPSDVLGPTAPAESADAWTLLTIDELEPRLTPDDFVWPPGLVNRQVGWGC